MQQELLGAGASVLSALTWTIGVSQFDALASRAPSMVIAWSRALVITPLFVLASLVSSAMLTGNPLAGWASLHADAWWWLLLAVFARVVGADTAFIWATRQIGSTLTIAVSASYPLFAAALGFVFRGEILNTAHLLGLFAVVIGIMVLTLQSQAQDRQNGKHHWLGVVAALFVASMWALSSLSIRNADIDAATSNAARSLLSLPVIIVMARSTPTRLKLLGWSDLRRFAPAFVCEGFLASYFGIFGIMHCPLGVATALSSLAPVFSLPLALKRKEPLSWSQVLATLTVVVGSIVLAAA